MLGPGRYGLGMRSCGGRQLGDGLGLVGLSLWLLFVGGVGILCGGL